MKTLRHVVPSLNSRWKCSPAEEAIKILFVRISLWSQAESVILRNNHSYMIHRAFLHGHNHLVFNTYYWFIISRVVILQQVWPCSAPENHGSAVYSSDVLTTHPYLPIAHPGPSFPPVCGQIDFNCFIITNLICAERSPCAVRNLLFILSVVQEVCYTGLRYKNRLIQSGCLFTGPLLWSSK